MTASNPSGAPDATTRRLGANIRRIRLSLPSGSRRASVSLQAFGRLVAERAGVARPYSKATVSRWEYGLQVPRRRALAAIAELGRLGVDDLLGGDQALEPGDATSPAPDHLADERPSDPRAVVWRSASIRHVADAAASWLARVGVAPHRVDAFRRWVASPVLLAPAVDALRSAPPGSPVTESDVRAAIYTLAAAVVRSARTADGADAAHPGGDEPARPAGA